MRKAYAQQEAPADESAASPEEDLLTVAEPISLDPDVMLDKVEGWILGFQRLIPNFLAAFLVIALFILIGWIAGRVFRSWARRRGRANLGEVLGSFLKWVFIVLGILFALTIILPSVRPGDLLAGLGIGSVAIGFAFKDILQNWLAGLLLLLRQPFQVGDQIIVNGYEGTVDWIETRATIITTYDRRRVIIPNSDVYSNAVTVNTAHRLRRSQYDVGIGYGDDIATARAAILAALADTPGVESEPKFEVLVSDLASSTVNLRVRWWTNSVRTDVVQTQAAALEAIKASLDKAGIDMPFDTQVLLFHDQTEELDGVRGRQREGWPKPVDGEPPRPAREIEAERAAGDRDQSAGSQSSGR